MLSYIVIIVGILSGALGFFYSRDGERNAVNGVGWAMAALLLAGGAINLFVEYQKRQQAITAAIAQSDKETIERKRQAEVRQSQAIAAARQKWVSLVDSAQLNKKAVVQSATFFFEFPADQDGNVPSASPGFVGPFPILPKGKTAKLVLTLGDALATEYWFSQEDAATIKLEDHAQRKTYFLRNEEVSLAGGVPSPDDASKNSEWWAQQEPAPSGFVYGTTIPLTVQLRRLVNQMATPESFGYFQFSKGDLTPDLRARLKKGFATSIPTYRVAIFEGEGDAACTTYLGLALEVRDAGLIVSSAGSDDIFEFGLTPHSFSVETCNNDPF